MSDCFRLFSLCVNLVSQGTMFVTAHKSTFSTTTAGELFKSLTLYNDIKCIMVNG